ITRRRQRIHSQHPIARRYQRADEQTAIGLRRDRHLSRLLGVRSDQLMEPAHSLDALRQTNSSEPSTDFVLNMDIVMGFRPVMTNKHLRHQHLPVLIGSMSPRRPAAT